MAGWYRFDPDRKVLYLEVYVQPGARRTEIVGRYGDRLKLRIAAPAHENRANAALMDFFASALNVSAGSVTITHGLRGRSKSVEILATGAAALQVVASWDVT